MENIREDNKISDKEILKNVAKAVNRSITMLASDINEKKGTLFQITAGRNYISTRLKSKIIEFYENVNPDYIEYGHGKIILSNKDDSSEEFEQEVFMQLALLDKKVSLLSDKLSTLIVALSKKI